MQIVYGKRNSRRTFSSLGLLATCVLSLLSFALPTSANTISNNEPTGKRIPSSNQCLTVERTANNVNLLPYIQNLIDDAQTFNVPKHDFSEQITQNFVNQFQSAISDLNFIKVSEQGRQLVLGSALTDHWVYFCLQSPSQDDVELVLSFGPAITAEIDFYPLASGQLAYQTGNALAMSTRDIHSPEFSFNVELPAHQTRDFYLRINARTSAYLEASVSSKPNYVVIKDKTEALDGLFMGIFFGLMLYTVLLYISVRQSSSLFYIASCLSLLALFLSIDGRILQYLLPDNPETAYFFTVMAYPASLFMSVFFVREFIQLNKHRRLDKIGLLIVGIFAVALITCYQISYAMYFKTCALFALVISIYYGLVSPLYGHFLKGSNQSKYLLISQLPFILTVLDRCLFAIGITDVYLVPYTPKVGLVFAMIFLAYYIGLTVYEERNRAQNIALEQELKAQGLIEIDETKSKFFANISHEFRTPLTLIQGPLKQLSSQLDPIHRKVINGALEQAKGLQTLVDQVLTLSEFDEKALSIQASKVNIVDTTRLMVSQFDSLASANSLQLNFESSVKETEIYLDIDKFQTILSNLLNNAFKFTPENGSITVQINKTASMIADAERPTTDNHIEIRVIDTGHGISADELNHVFDRFFQSTSSALSGSGRGTGIGLSLVKELVDLHGGTITVESIQHAETSNQSANGTIFSVYFPLGRAHLNSNEVTENTIDLPFEDNWLHSSDENEDSYQVTPNSNIKLLVVDDNTDMRDYLNSLLEKDYQVAQASDGIEGEKIAKEFKPDLIITDLMMPGRDGIEFARALKKDSAMSSIPVIMLSAKTSINDRLAGLLAPVDDYMSKPFDARELKVRILNLLRKHKQFSAFYQQDSAKVGDNEKTAQTDTSNTEEDEFIIKAREIADQNVADPLFGVNELAEQLHISRATLARRLVQISEFTPSEFLRHCRLDKARQLVAQGQVSSLKELSAAVGFSQPSYFSRLYQRTFNSSPLEVADD